MIARLKLRGLVKVGVSMDNVAVGVHVKFRLKGVLQVDSTHGVHGALAALAALDGTGGVHMELAVLEELAALAALEAHGELGALGVALGTNGEADAPGD